MKGRNGTIDFFKFLFTIIIVFYHLDNLIDNPADRITKCGYIAVEFFFIVSGYLLMKKADKVSCANGGGSVFKENLQMIKHKWLSFFPFLLLSIVMAILFWCYKTDFTARTFSWYVIHTLTDLFPLQFLGFNGSFPTGVAWYLSVLLFLSFVFFPILVKYKDKFIPYFAPIIMFGTYGYICYVSNGTICSITVWTGVTVLGMLRGVGDMILGFIAYYFTKKLDGVERSVSQKVWITVAECFCYISVIVFVFFYGQADSMDFYIILLLFIAISISFSKQSYLGKIFNAKICGFLWDYD